MDKNLKTIFELLKDTPSFLHTLNDNQRSLFVGVLSHSKTHLAKEKGVSPQAISNSLRIIFLRAVQFIDDSLRATDNSFSPQTASLLDQQRALYMVQRGYIPDSETYFLPLHMFSKIPSPILHALQHAGVYRMGDLCLLGRKKLQTVRNIGEKGIVAIDMYMEKHQCYFYNEIKTP